MDQIFGNIASLGLLVLLFSAIARRSPDDRLRCWVAGWVWLLVYTALKLWTPAAPLARLANACLGVYALAFAAIFFQVSAMILREGRRAGLRLGGLIAILTLPCLTLALVQPRTSGLLAFLVLARQGTMIVLAMRTRVHRTAVLSIVLPALTLSLAWMIYGLAHSQSQPILLALFAEMYFVAGADLWFNGSSPSLGLVTTCSGLIVFAAIFPATIFIQWAWPGSSAAVHVAGVASFAAAIGMILIVLEEHARSARQTMEEYRLTFDTNPHPIWIYDIETLEFLSVNQAACSTHGYTREEFSRLRLTDLVDNSEMPQILAHVASSAPSSNKASRHHRKDGSVIPLEITAHSIVFRGRRARFVLGIDVTEREELQRQVHHQSRHDALTGLPNRVLFDEQFRAIVAGAADSRRKLAILCLNIDRFKRINDTYGTAIGDLCLQHVAGILRAQAGSEGLAARMGGDRFALVLTGLRGGLPVEHVIAQMMDAFREPIVAGDTKIRLSVRAGLALCPEDGLSVDCLWRNAESALARARDAGGAQVVWSSTELRVAAEQQVELEAFMRDQLECGGFHLAYQPLYSIDGRLEGLEALARLNHPAHGPISPARFIPLAEETGLIVPLGEWVLEEACRQLSAWRDAGIHPVPIAVNVSGLQLTQPTFADRLIATLSRFSIGPELIDLEVTESTNMLNVAEVMRQMTILTELGFRFSLDDFGTGHSTLNRLDRLPLRVLKVDQAFTERLCAVNGTRSIVQAMIWMGKALNMRVIAEGVERIEQVAALREMGCDSLQGFLLSRPLPPSEIPPLLDRFHPLLSPVPVLRHHRR